MEKDKIKSALDERKSAGKSIVNLSFADFTSLPSMLEMRPIQRAFVNVFMYPYYFPTARGDKDTRGAVAKYFKKNGTAVDHDRIFVCAGTNEALAYLFKIASLTGKSVLCPSPRAPQIDEIAAFVGAKIVDYSLVPGKNFDFDAKDLAKKISGNVGMLLLQSPNMPTGKVFAESQLLAILKLCRDKKIPVIADESYADFVFKKGFARVGKLAGAKDTVVTVGGVSNGMALPGAKIAWTVFEGDVKSGAELMKAMELLADTFLHLNQFSESVIIELLKYGRKWRKKPQKFVLKNRSLVQKMLKKSREMEAIIPDGGFYVLLKPKNWRGSDRDLSASLIGKQGVYYHPASYYGLEGKNASLVLCLMNEARSIKTALKKTMKFLKNSADGRKIKKA